MRIPLPNNTATATFINGNRRDAIDLDMEEVGRSGSGRITVKVLGYWSSEPITLYINRRGSWDFEVSHSSGGRDSKEEPDSLRAGINFGKAMVALCEWAQVAFSAPIVVWLEEAYQRQRAEDKAEQEAKELAKQQAIDADQPLGKIGAHSVLNFLVSKAQQRIWVEETLLVYPRGSDKPYNISAKCSGDRVTLRSRGSVISRKALLEELANTSHRTNKES